MTTIVPVAPQLESQISDFKGPWTRLDSGDVPAGQALAALNTEYDPSQCGERTGFASLFNANKAITSLFNWLKASDLVSTQGNYLVLYNATDGKVQWIPNLAAPALVDLFTVSAEAVDPSSSGNQLFLPTVSAASQTTPVGAAQCRIVGIYSAATNVDKAFLGPITTKPTLSEISVGTVTAGSHFVGYIITTRNGYTGKICPVTSLGDIDLTSSITASGGKQIFFSLTVTWPAEAMSIQLVMTAVTNPFQYFVVPGAFYSVPGGGTTTVTATIDLSDAQLVNNTTDITDNQYFLTQDVVGAGPFSPFKVVVYGSRTVYVTYDVGGIFSLYISELENPQQLTEQFHKRRLPGFLKGTSAFVLRQNLYVLGPNWTFSFEDNCGLPATWATPVLVDGRLGTPSTMGVTVNASGDWAAVVHISGLYIFNGAYSDKPVSYMVDDQWRRINWAAAQTIRIADNHDKKQILVAVPLDAATTPTHLMMFDYSNGLDYLSVMFSLWNLSGYNPRGLCVAQNVATSRAEFLLGRSTAGKILRQMNTTDDVAPWSDDGAAIDFEYEIGPQPDGAVGVVYGFTGMFVRATGSGVPTITSYSLDHAKSARWAKPITLAANPGVEYFRQFYLKAECCSTRFVLNGPAGSWMSLAGIRQKYYEYAQRR